MCSEESLVKVREDLPWAPAALIGCSVATGIGAVIRHAKVEAGSSVLVIGCGGVGLNVVQGARLAGAEKIIAVDLLDNKLDYARQFGATHTINAKTEEVVKRVRAITGLGVDYSFDAIGGEQTAAPDRRCAGARRPRHHHRHAGAFGAHVDLAIHVRVRSEAPQRQLLWVRQSDRVDFPHAGRPLHVEADRHRQPVSPHLSARRDQRGFERLRAGSVARGVIVFD